MSYAETVKIALNDYKLAHARKPSGLLVHPAFYDEALKEFRKGEPVEGWTWTRSFDCWVRQDPKVKECLAVGEPAGSKGALCR